MKRKKTTHIVVHSSHTRTKENIGLKELDRRCRLNGYLRIIYHYIIKRDGMVEEGRPDDQAIPHMRKPVDEYNNVSIAVCFIGGRASTGDAAVDNFTAKQREAFRGLVAKLQQKYPEVEDIVGVQELDPREVGPAFTPRYIL